METNKNVSVKYVKEPGYLYDLIYLFCVYFNREYILKSSVIYDNAKADIAHYNEIYHTVGFVSDRLRAFFHLEGNKPCLISRRYHSKQAEFFRFPHLVTIEQFTELFRDKERITQAMNKVYFPQIEHDEICQLTVEQISELLEESAYSSELKLSILNFYIQPDKTIQLLIDTMREKELVLKQYHKKYAKKMRKIVEAFDIYEVAENVKRYPGKSLSLELYEPIYYSVCIVNKNFMMYLAAKTELLVLIGAEHRQFLEFLLHQVDAVEIDLFGKIMSEENRIKILEMLLEQVEVTKNDIIQALGISMTATHYHLGLMLQARMLTVHRKGRSQYYRLNKEYFDRVINELRRYSAKCKVECDM